MPRPKPDKIEKYLESIKEAVQEFKGGPYFKIRVIGHLNMSRDFASLLESNYNVDEHLKKQANDIPEIITYDHPFDRIIRKGEVSTAWQRGSTTVIAVGMEHLIVNETLTKFSERIGWEL